MSDVSPAQPLHLNSLSALSAKSFPSTEALIEAILTLNSEQLGLRTSFLTHITVGDNINRIVAVHNQPGGCDLDANIDVPLEDTFCSAIASSTGPGTTADQQYTYRPDISLPPRSREFATHRQFPRCAGRILQW